MPRLVDTMTQGSVVAWRKREGEPVQAGEVIAEIEADKATVDLNSPGDGILDRILVPAGSEHVAVGQVLAILGPAGHAVADPRAEPAPAPLRPPDRDNGHAVQVPAAMAPAETAGAATDISPLAREHGTAGRSRCSSRSRQRSREAASRGLM